MISKCILAILRAMKVYENYLVTSKLNLDLPAIKNSCYKMLDVINKNFTVFTDGGYEDASGKSPMSTRVHNQYNLLLFNFDEFHSLYFEIQKLFREVNSRDDKYYIQAWLNMYKKGEFIDWHEHYPPHCNSWHGFYCVDCEPSKTTYKIPNVSEPVDIVSENNLLVMSRSAGDWHRTWPWEYEDRDRITIAFDIVPRKSVDDSLNHWMPI